MGRRRARQGRPKFNKGSKGRDQRQRDGSERGAVRTKRLKALGLVGQRFTINDTRLDELVAEYNKGRPADEQI